MWVYIRVLREKKSELGDTNSQFWGEKKALKVYISKRSFFSVASRLPPCRLHPQTHNRCLQSLRCFLVWKKGFPLPTTHIKYRKCCSNYLLFLTPKFCGNSFKSSLSLNEGIGPNNVNIFGDDKVQMAAIWHFCR